MKRRAGSVIMTCEPGAVILFVHDENSITDTVYVQTDKERAG